MRFYVAPDSIFPEKNIIEIRDKKELHHIRDVMRLEKGDAVDIFDGKGKEFSGTIAELNKNSIVIKILGIKSVVEEGLKPFPTITLYQAIPKKSKMDIIIEKAVELGVERIVPIISDRTIPDAKVLNPKKIERWARIGVAASKQCGRIKLPSISNVINFKTAIDEARENDLIIFAALDRSAQPLKMALRDSVAKNIAVFVGPEGDFAPEEISIVKEKGFSISSLGPLVLKVETAAIYILSCLVYEYGYKR